MSRTPQQIPIFLESAVKEIAESRSGLTWHDNGGIEDLLKTGGFPLELIRPLRRTIEDLYLRTRKIHDENQIYPPQPAPPLSPPLSQDTHRDCSTSAGSSSPEQAPSLSTAPRVETPTDLPKTVHVHIEGEIYDPMNCVHTQCRDESRISYEVIENRRITGQIKDSKIRLTWKKSYCEKTTTTLFHVVRGIKIESGDIEFGRMWLEGPPEKKRKGLFAETDDGNVQPTSKRQQHHFGINLKAAGILIGNAVHEYVRQSTYQPLPSSSAERVCGTGESDAQETAGLERNEPAG